MSQHQMLDYIREQPEAVANTLRRGQSRLSELREMVARRHPQDVVVAGLGSSYTAAQMASPLLRRCLPAPTTVTVATEVGVDLGLPLGPGTLMVFVSRSGERGGIVDAQRAARQAGALCVAVTAVESSLLAQEADLVILTGEGPESTFAKTKSVMASTVALMQLALALDLDQGEERSRVGGALAQVPELLAVGIKDAERDSARIGSWLARHQLVLVTGTAGNQGVAQEGALKLQEAARMTAQWEETGNALCGSVGMLGPAWLFVGLVAHADRALNLALLKLVHHFGADRLCIAEPGLALEESVEELMLVPRAGDPLVAPLMFLPPMQLLTHQFALARGLNPDDQPFADVLLAAMLPPGREEPDWRPVPVPGESSTAE